VKKIITYGTFDTFHYGHFFLLERTAALGTHLTVCISTDEFNSQKGKCAVFNWETRCRIIQNLSFVDKVLPEENWSQKINDVLENRIDIFAIGDDWKGKFDFLKDYCEVVYIPRTQNISSTIIRKITNAN
jgi:glycerol-3-phosphate cytidylyltransferase